MPQMFFYYFLHAPNASSKDVPKKALSSTPFTCEKRTVMKIPKAEHINISWKIGKTVFNTSS